MQIHFDPLGGWSGDMFAAAMLDAFPDLWPAVERAIEALELGPEARCTLVPHRDQALTGRRFQVAAELSHAPDHHHDHGGHDHERGNAASHGHRAWTEIRGLIERSGLDRAVKDHAVAIFGLLAEAEAEVHGVPVEAVTFHEVGAVDSIVDIVAAAQLIAGCRADGWTSAALPLGSGRVRTQHGLLLVPAPATALLLRGLPTIDDGIPGERVTPTGAAIARYLLGEAPPLRGAPRRLLAAGTGFGSRHLPGVSNCLRVLAFEPLETSQPGPGFAHRELCVIAFEVDDLSAEDLAHGLDHIRAMAGIHDVIQSVAFGKKGRMATQVQVLAAPEALESAIAACFTETTTIGLRYHTVRGAVLPRAAAEASLGDRRLRVKTVQRPGGCSTAKAEAADVAAEPGHAARVALRRKAEAAVLATLDVPVRTRP